MSLKCFTMAILIITIIISSEVQSLKKPSALYKEHDGSRELVNVRVQKSNKTNIKHIH